MTLSPLNKNMKLEKLQEKCVMQLKHLKYFKGFCLFLVFTSNSESLCGGTVRGVS